MGESKIEMGETVDLVARCQAALAAATRPRPPSPAFLEAVRQMRAGDGAGAAKSLVGLDDRARQLATGLLERLGAKLGVAPAAIQAVGLPLARDLASGAVEELSSVGWLWDQGWDAEVLTLVHKKRLAHDRQGGAAVARLLPAVRESCAAGDLRTAAMHAGAIDPYHKDTRALALCALGAASRGEARDAHLLDAVKAARGDAMIENGSEESTALGSVVEELAALVPADHPAVDAACKALLALGKKRVKGDARSYGLSRAASAAAQRREPAWLARAGALIASIHSEQLTWTPLLYMALAHRAAGAKKAESAALGRIAKQAWLGEAKVRALYPDRAELLAQHWSDSPSPFDEIALIRAAGGDASDRIEAAIEAKREWSGGLEDAYAALVSIDAEIAARVLAEIDEPAAAHHAAADSLEMDGRLDEAREHFVKALDLGLRGAKIAQHERLLADRALRERVQAIAVDEPELDDRAAALSDLAELWWRDGEIERAIGAIGHLTVPPSGEEEKVWEPLYLRGDDDGERWRPYAAEPVLGPAAPPPAGTFEAKRAALKKLPERERFDPWCELAQLLDDPSQLRVVRGEIARSKARKMSPVRAHALVEIDLRLGDFEAALEAARALRTGYYCVESVVHAARRIAEQLVAQPGALRLARALAVIDLFKVSHPSLVGPCLLTALPTLMVALPERDREALVKAAHTRLKGCAASVKAAEAIGRAWGGDVALASKLLAEAIAGRGDDLSGEELARAVALAERHARLPDRRALLRAAMARCTGATYQLCQAIERTARYLWLTDEVDLLPELLRSELFPSDVRDQARRSLVVDAPAHAPRPVDAVLAAWSDDPPNRDQAVEQVRCLAAALEREGRAAEAERVRATLA